MSKTNGDIVVKKISDILPAGTEAVTYKGNRYLWPSGSEAQKKYPLKKDHFIKASRDLGGVSLRVAHPEQRRGFVDRTFFPETQVAAEFENFGNPIAADCYQFQRGLQTYVAREKVPDVCGVKTGTADKWAKKGLVEKLTRAVAGGKQPDGAIAPYVRTFYVKQQIDAENAPRVEPLQSRSKPRTTSEIWKLDANDFITVPEMASVGVSAKYARDHWDYKTKLRTRAIPSPISGKLITTKRGEQISDRVFKIKTKLGRREQKRTHKQPVPLVRWGDIRDILHILKNPPIPEGGRLVRDALPELMKLKPRGIGMTLRMLKSRVSKLIRQGVIKGGEVDHFTSNLRAARMLWMSWPDRDKVFAPQTTTPAPAATLASATSALRHKRGRPAGSIDRSAEKRRQMKDDAAIARAWGTKAYKTYEELARERGQGESKGDILQALDRHRKTPNSAGN
jgi:hypothetical protein